LVEVSSIPDPVEFVLIDKLDTAYRLNQWQRPRRGRPPLSAPTVSDRHDGSSRFVESLLLERLFLGYALDHG
jgi:hypothetical protein